MTDDVDENIDEGSISDLSALPISNLTPFTTVVWTSLCIGQPQPTFPVPFDYSATISIFPIKKTFPDLVETDRVLLQGQI